MPTQPALSAQLRCLMKSGWRTSDSMSSFCLLYPLPLSTCGSADQVGGAICKGLPFLFGHHLIGESAHQQAVAGLLQLLHWGFPEKL